MKRESFVFYKSFYESIKELDPLDQVQIYNAIFNYQFEGEESELKGICKSIFTLIIPQLEANNKRYLNGLKGGAPKGNRNATKKQPKNNLDLTKKQPNVNDNDNVNDNVNDNDNVNVNDNGNSDLFDFIQNNFGRMLRPVEIEEILKWEDNEVTRHAIKQAVLNGAYSTKYINTILDSYKAKNITTVVEAQKADKKFKERKEEEDKYKGMSYREREYYRGQEILDQWTEEGD